ncbi:unnamed protein product [Cylicostephanus goldi]|uniref:Uncharacterized protein n=1 Tax=Cylicostephanus goldi TaxID=71465 RepID=A0A3P6SC20_CYLGO|nr:unnamed protein product [Cylicostephanus goldi]
MVYRSRKNLGNTGGGPQHIPFLHSLFPCPYDGSHINPRGVKLLAVGLFSFHNEFLAKDLLGVYELSTMSTIPVEVAEEALEKKVEAMKIVDGNNMEVKKETTDGKNERRERKVR